MVVQDEGFGLLSCNSPTSSLEVSTTRLCATQRSCPSFHLCAYSMVAPPSSCLLHSSRWGKPAELFEAALGESCDVDPAMVLSLVEPHHV